jgi:hypothetical protein
MIGNNRFHEVEPSGTLVPRRPTMNYRAAASTNLVVLAFGPNVIGMNPATGQRIWSV